METRAKGRARQASPLRQALAWLLGWMAALALAMALGLALAGCGVKQDPLLGPEIYEQYIPEPVVRMIIFDGDTLYDGNQ